MSKRCCYRAVNPELDTVAHFSKLLKAVEWIKQKYGFISIHKLDAPNKIKIVTDSGTYMVLPIQFEE